MSHPVERISRSSAGAAARTLAAAFATDPVFLWMAGRRSMDADRLVPGFRAIIDAELRREQPEAFAAAAGGCVSLWHGIDQWKSGVLENLRTAPGFLRSFGIGRVPTLLRTQAALERAHPTAPHYHLAFIGTDPARQGNGLGATTLAPMLERCDAEGVPAYLESSNPANEAFYVRHGFAVTERIELPDGAPPINAMWREPAS